VEISTVKVFISYSHAHAEWVFTNLEPCLRAGGAEVLIDRRNFVAGPGVVGQMDAVQDRADRHILAITKEYLQSEKCLHEMRRAIALDPEFERQLVLVTRCDDAALPGEIKRFEPVHIDLRGDAATQWDFLLDACGASLGTTAPAWLAARKEIVRLLEQDRSVNLVVKGSVKWETLVDDLMELQTLRMANIDLNNPETASRRGLIEKMLEALGAPTKVPHPPEDLPQFGKVLGMLGRSRLAVRHFDLVLNRPEYGIDLFAALRFMVMDRRQLVLLAQSRKPFAALLPQDHPISKIHVETVELGP
jgi:hypothetical protein